MYSERRAVAVAATVWRAAGPVVPGPDVPGPVVPGPAAARAATATALAAAGPSTGSVAHRVLPDGCMDLIWIRPGPDEAGEVIVAGPDTASTLATWSPGVLHLGLRFDSAVGPAHIGVPASEVRDRRVALADIWGAAEASRLAKSLATAGEPAAAFEREIVRRSRRDEFAGLLPPFALAGIRAGTPVAEVARAAALSERQLLRRCQLALGYGPKTLARIVRFRSAVALARAGTPFADVAATAGYADQAHLARDVRALGGVPLRELIGGPAEAAAPAGDA
jgi:AraC-like DNA-binding protein